MISFHTFPISDHCVYLLLLQNASGNKIFCFSIFFFEELKKGYNEVKTWTQEHNIFEKEYIIVPMNNNEHWTMVVCINFYSFQYKRGVYNKYISI